MVWRRKWQPTPVVLPGESHGWRSLVGCSPWGRTELDTTEATQQQQQQHDEVNEVLDHKTDLRSGAISIRCILSARHYSRDTKELNKRQYALKNHTVQSMIRNIKTKGNCMVGAIEKVYAGGLQTHKTRTCHLYLVG